MHCGLSLSSRPRVGVTAIASSSDVNYERRSVTQTVVALDSLAGNNLFVLTRPRPAFVSGDGTSAVVYLVLTRVLMAPSHVDLSTTPVGEVDIQPTSFAVSGSAYMQQLPIVVTGRRDDRADGIERSRC